jgi:tetratricopeptide (TPR) repeat protein
MSDTRKTSLLIAAVTGSLYGVLTVAFFPMELQLRKYPMAAAQYLADVLPPERVLDFSPLYLYLHLLNTWTFGASRSVIVALQILAVAAAAALLFLFLVRTLPSWVALAGTAAFALNRSVVAYAAVLEPEAFLLLALIAFLYFSTSSNARDHLLAGGALAVAVAIRPNALLLMLFVPALYALDNEWKGRRGWIAPTLRVVTPALVVLLALAVRNERLGGGLSPVAMNPGFVLYEGNNPLSSGRSAIYPPSVGELSYYLTEDPDSPHLGYRMVASRSSGRSLTTAEANRFWRARTLDFIADEPFHFAGRLATKAYSAFHSHRFHDLIPAERFDRRMSERWIPTVPFALVAALALLGVVLGRAGWRRSLLLHGLFASQLLILVGVYVSERQRLALLPALIFFASVALAYLVRAKRGERIALGAACVVLAGLLSIPLSRAREERHVFRVYEVRERTWLPSFALRDQGRNVEAAEAAVVAYAVAPWLADYSRPAKLPLEKSLAEGALDVVRAGDANPSRQLDRAQLLMAAGRLAEAEELLASLVAREEKFDRGFLQSSQPLHYLGRIQAMRGQRDEAVASFTDALAAAPGDPFTLAWLAALTGEDEFRRRIVRYFSEVDAALLVGVAQLEAGDAHGAASSLSEAVRLVPELWRAKIYLAAALGAKGDLGGAVKVYMEAMTQRSDPVMLEERIVPIFAAAAGSGEPAPHYEHGLVLAQFGRFAEALGELELADPGGARPEVAAMIADVERRMSPSPSR